jgi:predicted lysophospholipase L1 biosynthesis ABC-type transport system permease subunit
VLLPRLATWLDAEDCLFLRARIIARLFIGSDICTFLIQAAGGGMTAMEKYAATGEKVRLALCYGSLHRSRSSASSSSASALASSGFS